MRIVLATNVLLSGLLFGGVCGSLIDTCDDDLLVLENFRGIPILSPRDVYQRLS